MTSRKALGKGLSVLIPDSGKIASRVTDIPLKEIVRNRYQPRKTFKEEAIKELADSIKENGIIQPVLVRKTEKGYELIAGERRYRASQLLGFQTIPAIIKSVKKSEALELALVENIQREDLSPLEEAKAYKLLMEEFGLTQQEVGKKVGKERSSVANSLRLLKLPAIIQKDIESGRLTTGHAKALLACGGEAEMMEMRGHILKYGLNVRDVESKTKKRKPAKKKTVEEGFIRDLQEKIVRKLSTKVTIKQGRKGKGVISIEYYSLEDLDRILEIISAYSA